MMTGKSNFSETRFNEFIKLLIINCLHLNEPGSFLFKPEESHFLTKYDLFQTTRQRQPLRLRPALRSTTKCGSTHQRDKEDNLCTSTS